MRPKGLVHPAAYPNDVAIIADIIRSFESWAPEATAESWDNVGLQVGDKSTQVERALVALDLTPGVVKEAREQGVQLVVTHHPAIFRPIHAIRADDLVGSMLLDLARSGIALYTAHTNLDAARGGVSFALADALGLQGVEFLAPNDGDRNGNRVKLVTFVPESHVETVYTALSEAGAGTIGRYTECAFMSAGTGRYRVPENGDPMTGSPGSREQVDEIRLEMETRRPVLSAVLAALRSTHPYEEVAFDVIPLEGGSADTGMGAIGNLPQPMLLPDFINVVAESLGVAGLRYSGADDRTVERVAVCGGSGSGLIAKARSAGADAFVTGDVTYHRYFEPLQPDGTRIMALVDAGHYETERPVEAAIIDRMGSIHGDVAFIRTGIRTGPVRHPGR